MMRFLGTRLARVGGPHVVACVQTFHSQIQVAITNSCPNNSRRLASELLAARYEDLMPRWFGLDLPFLAANVFRSCRACLR